MKTTISVALLGLFLLSGSPAFAQEASASAQPAVEEEFDIDEPSPSEAADAQAEDSAAAAAPIKRDPAAMDPAPADPSLLGVYRAFGEQAGLVALMDDFMPRLLADKRTRRFFENSDQAMVKKHLVEQFCVILGGPCSYTGRDMRTAHKGFDIDRAQFNALVEVLQVSMSSRGIPFRAQNKLLARLAPMHRDIEHR